MVRGSPKEISNCLGGVALVCLLMQAGCSTVEPLTGVIATVNGQVSVAQVDEWIEQGKLSQAHQALERQTEDNPEWPTLKRRKSRLNARIAEIEHRVLSQASYAQVDEDWLKARALLQEGRSQLPHSEALREAETLLNFQMKEEAAGLERQMTLVKAKYLESLHPLLEQMNHLDDSGWDHIWRNRSFQREQKKVLRGLLECSDFALVAQDLVLAENCLRYAGLLDPLLQLDERKALLATLKSLPAHQRITAKTKKRPRPKKKAVTPSSKRMVKPKSSIEVLPSAEEVAELSSIKFQFQQHFYLNEWHQADQLLQTLEDRIPRDNKLRLWRRELDKQINQAINIGLNEGENYYSQGLLDQALSTWHDLLELDPENLEVRERIERTERFIEKLNRLKAEGAS